MKRTDKQNRPDFHESRVRRQRPARPPLTDQERALRELGYVVRTLPAGQAGDMAHKALQACVVAVQQGNTALAQTHLDDAIAVLPQLAQHQFTGRTLVYLATPTEVK